MQLLKFQASWCQPCKMLSKTMEGINHPLIESKQEIDIDEDMEKVKQYNIRGVPTLILIDDEGKEVKRQSGYMSESQILKFLEV